MVFYFCTFNYKNNTMSATITIDNQAALWAFSELIDLDKITRKVENDSTFGPMAGSVYHHARPAEKIAVSKLAPGITFFKHNDFFNFVVENFQEESRNGNTVTLAGLPDEKKIEIYDTWSIDFQTRHLLIWIYGPRTLVDLDTSALRTFGFHPGLAILVHRDARQVADTLDEFVNQAFLYSSVNKDRLKDLRYTDQLAWVREWRETIFCHVNPLSLGIPKHSWGDLILPELES